MTHSPAAAASSRSRPDARLASFSIDTERPFPGADEAVHRYLDLFDRLDMRATFFVVGRTAEERPDLVDAIYAAGHEVACHGWDHPYIGSLNGMRAPFVNELDDATLDADLQRCCRALTRDGQAPSGFRAPWFRIDPRNLDVVARYFQYDSSFTPTRAAQLELPAGLAELPVSTLAPNGPKLGTSLLFGPGALQATALWLRFKPRNPLVLYGHSFDLVKNPGGALRTSRLKRAWYFDRCGADRAADLARLVRSLRDAGYSFVTCREQADRNASACPAVLGPV